MVERIELGLESTIAVLQLLYTERTCSSGFFFKNCRLAHCVTGLMYWRTALDKGIYDTYAHSIDRTVHLVDCLLLGMWFILFLAYSVKPDGFASCLRTRRWQLYQ